ncbi:MAG: (E)-4-hydroxy-3-methylbut-2-enyl-diphosphate synthase [Puniceicoccales bacterium]|nr:(E)-4-hydroxy-3-methylbut-2-enyl-diphosphate synthase [Puniceicoccales bacterium]
MVTENTFTTTDPASCPRYCFSRYYALRRRTCEVSVGNVGIGAGHPVRLQSMTTSDTLDVAATVRQCINLAEVGCEIIRITAPNKAAAAALREISRDFRSAGFGQPLVADIHFTPDAALEAVEHVEKVRINPGNFADKKRFSVHDYTDAEYDVELERIHKAATPLILRAKALGRALRIGTNHGSLSDRIMNRYGDSPLGMVESALEFIRICESHGFRSIVLSMKASNPKVMVQAYRLAVARMNEEGMSYPLHLGVTEAGEGEDARIKSAIGIGALLQDGLGDTIRVSLTEDPWYEIPVAADLAARAARLWALHAPVASEGGTIADDHDSLNPFEHTRREGASLLLTPSCAAGGVHPPRVIVPATQALSAETVAAIAGELRATHATQREIRAEGLLVRVPSPDAFSLLPQLGVALRDEAKAVFAEIGDFLPGALAKGFRWAASSRLIITVDWDGQDIASVESWANFCARHKTALALAAPVHAVGKLAALRGLPPDALALTLRASGDDDATQPHALGHYRALAKAACALASKPPLWIRNTATNTIQARTGGLPPETSTQQAPVASYDPAADFPSRLIESSMLSGTLFCDGLGDLISIEDVPSQAKALTLAYDILQGARMRISKTEYVACPSCGRTLFDIQATTQKIKSRTGHLKGVTIAVMGCIVNGPGEMADADFGYVGGAPGKINLYVRRECVKFGISQNEAVDRLVDLIKEHGKWVEPDASPAGSVAQP